MYIEALDTLFFRDGKPFSMGEDIWAQGIFPPSPTTIYGALRTAFISQQMARGFSSNIDELIKESENLFIRNIYYIIDEKPYFPMPFDLICYKNQERFDVHFLNLKEYQFGSNPTPMVLVAPFNQKAEDSKDYLISSQSVMGYLLFHNEEILPIRISNYLVNEPKIGIARNNHTKTTTGDAEGKLYRVNLQRFESQSGKKLKIAVEYSGLDLGNQGVIKFGAENKTAYFYHPENAHAPNMNLKPPDFKSDILRLYLLTPAILKNGHIPEIFLKEKADFELITYTIGKPQYIGGFDLARQMPRYMFKAVPPGSVYYFRTKKEPEEIISLFMKTNPLNEIGDFDRQGFGRFLLGTYLTST